MQDLLSVWWNSDGDEMILAELWPLSLSTFGNFVALLAKKFV